MLVRIPRLWLAIGGVMLGVVGPMVSQAHAASWHLQSVPPAPSQTQGSGQLNGVSCPSASFCLAVGELGAAEDIGPSTTLGERWNGSSWTQQTTRNAPGPYAQELEGVSCYSTTACTAIGYTRTNVSNTPDGVGAPLAERYNGRSWSIQRTPADPNGTFEIFWGVSCPASSGCIAVGSEDNSAGNLVPVAERWNGSSWTLIRVPMPSGSTGASLAHLSCRSMTWCEAVGQSYGASNSVSAVIEHFDGTKWTLQTPPAQGGELAGVGCASTTECFAVGELSGPQSYSAVVDRFNGSSWTQQSTPALPNADYGELDSVYCASPNRCTATGWFEGNAGNGTSTLAERWTGRTWSIQPTPNPLDPVTSGNELKAVACPTTTTCESVGYAGAYTGDHGVLPLLAERYS